MRCQCRENFLEPSHFLVENIALLPKGRALDLAMGFGRNAIYLAKLGYAIDGVDISPEAVNGALASAQEAGLIIRAQVADLESGGYHIEKGAYDLIICFNYLYRPLLPQIKDGLKTGGMLVYETFIVDQVQFAKPRNPEHLLKHNELLDMFRDFRCLRYHEGIVGTHKVLAGIVAQKV